MFRGKTLVVLCDVFQMSNSGSHPQWIWHGESTPGAGKYRVIIDITNSQGTHHVHIVYKEDIVDLFCSANAASHYTGGSYVNATIARLALNGCNIDLLGLHKLGGT